MKRPINQRIKFLLDTFKLSARDFSRALEVPDNNTQNYLEPRFAQPKADYLEKILLHFESVNPVWLLTGKGEPLSTASPPAAVSHTGDFNIVGTVGTVGTGISQRVKVNKGQAQDLVKQLEDCQRDVESLKQQLARADALIASKDETISLLRIRFDRPN